MCLESLVRVGTPKDTSLDQEEEEVDDLEALMSNRVSTSAEKTRYAKRKQPDRKLQL